MSIRCAVGLPGMGKTLFLVYLLRQYLKLGKTCYWQSYLPIDYEELTKLYWHEKVIENIKKFFQGDNYKPIQWGKIVYYNKIKEFTDLSNGVIFMDEIQMYFNSRGWLDLPFELQYKFQQHRKDRIDIWGATQNIKRVEVVVRELIGTLFEMKKIGNLIIYKEFDIADIDKEKRKRISWGYFWLDDKLAKSYDTYAKISQFQDKIGI